MDNKEIFDRLQGDTPRVCKLGETFVVGKLTEMGWDAVNMNATNPNYKGVDVLAVNPKTLETKFIQVKSSAENAPNFMTGFLSDTQGVIEGDWKGKIKGPWVFVHIRFDDGKIVYDSYVLTDEETKRLIEDSNMWYWKELPHKHASKNNQPIGLPIEWITGHDDTSMKRGWRLYPRNIDIDDPCGDAGWGKIGVVES